MTLNDFMESFLNIGMLSHIQIVVLHSDGMETSSWDMDVDYKKTLYEISATYGDLRFESFILFTEAESITINLKGETADDQTK